MNKHCLHENKACSRLHGYVKWKKYRRVLLFTGRKSYVISGAETYIDRSLEGCEVLRVSDFEINPKVSDIRSIISQIGDQSFDCIVACGGGTVIDIAKLVNFSLSTGVDTGAFLEGSGAPVSWRSIPLIAVPTTSGTGSEATHFAVVYHEGIKYSLAFQQLRPHLAILNPGLTYKLSPYQTAVTAFDAFAQAVESLWAVSATCKSEKFARKALSCIVPNLMAVVQKPDPKNRAALQQGAYFAGRAIDLSKTTGAHAFSYYFTSTYGLPHGHAVALFLGRFLKFNYGVSTENCHHPKGADYVQKKIRLIMKYLDVQTVDDAVEKITYIMEQCGLFSSLDKTGFNVDKDISKLENNINIERLGNNPRRVNSVRDILAV